MPFRGGAAQVLHLEGVVTDQPNQRGSYAVRGVLLRVDPNGEREEIWDYYGAHFLPVSGMLDAEARRRINERNGPIIIYDRLWSPETPSRTVNTDYEAEQRHTARRIRQPLMEAMNNAPSWQDTAWLNASNVMSEFTPITRERFLSYCQEESADED